MLEQFKSLMNNFGVVTVMDATIYKLKTGYSYSGRGACSHGISRPLTPNDFVCTGLHLDTLKFSNFTQEGPTKIAKGGIHNNTIFKYGKTTRLEMQQVLGGYGVLQEFFGCEYDEEAKTLDVGENFPESFAIEGKTYFINQKTGRRVWVYIFIPCFIPDGIFNLVQDAEGDMATFDMNGTVAAMRLEEGNTTGYFYQIRKDSWFGNNVIPAYEDDNGKRSKDDYHKKEKQETIYDVSVNTDEEYILFRSSIALTEVQIINNYTYDEYGGGRYNGTISAEITEKEIERSGEFYIIRFSYDWLAYPICGSQTDFTHNLVITGLNTSTGLSTKPCLFSFNYTL
jgi:hypothetical protein